MAFFQKRTGKDDAQDLPTGDPGQPIDNEVDWEFGSEDFSTGLDSGARSYAG